MFGLCRKIMISFVDNPICCKLFCGLRSVGGILIYLKWVSQGDKRPESQWFMLACEFVWFL